jgi:hypothetical protein
MRETIVIPIRQLLIKRHRLFPHQTIITPHNYMEIRILGNRLLCRRHNQALARNFKIQNSNLKKLQINPNIFIPWLKFLTTECTEHTE